MSVSTAEGWKLGDTLWEVASGPSPPPSRHNDAVSRPQVIPAALDAAACDEVLVRARRIPPDLRSGVYRSDARHAKSHWLMPDADWRWLYEHVLEIFIEANRSYRFHIDRLVDPLLVAHYPPGPGFDWHIDTVTGTTSSRKISLSIPLTPGDAYDGGDLEIAPYATDRDARIQGNAVVFPSFLCHRVTPIARGHRAALVAWVHGTPFA